MIHERLNSMINVKWFGAKGNGINDDTLAIQAAINFGAPNIYLPAGVYLTSDAIRLRSNIKVCGDSFNTIIKNNRSNKNISRRAAFILGNHHPSAFDRRNNTDHIYPLDTIRSVLKGDSCVTLGNVSQISQYTTGDWVFVRSAEEEHFTGYTIPYFAQLTKISEINVDAGILYLEDNIDSSITCALVSRITNFDPFLRIFWHAVENTTVCSLALDAEDIFATRTCAYNCQVDTIFVKNVRQVFAFNAFCKSRLSKVRGTVKQRIGELKSHSYNSTVEDIHVFYVDHGERALATHLDLGEQSFKCNYKDIEFTIPPFNHVNVDGGSISSGYGHIWERIKITHSGSGNSGGIFFIPSRNNLAVSDIKLLNCIFISGSSHRTRYITIGNPIFDFAPDHIKIINLLGKGPLSTGEAIRFAHSKNCEIIGGKIDNKIVIANTSWPVKILK